MGAVWQVHIGVTVLASGLQGMHCGLMHSGLIGLLPDDRSFSIDVNVRLLWQLIAPVAPMVRGRPIVGRGWPTVGTVGWPIVGRWVL